MSDLLPCPFCGGEAFVNDDHTGNGGKPHMSGNVGLGRLWSVECDECGADAGFWQDRDVAIAAWNSRATLGSDGVARSNDGVMTELTAEQVRKAAKSNSRIYKSPVDDGIWIKEYDWQAIADELNSRAERTCKIESSYLNDFTNKYECWYEFEMQCGYKFTWDEMEPPNYCPNCGAKVLRNTPKCSETTTKVVGE